ncbi:hypothetical protein LCGC14_1305050 [marine sediment metagenome]|uniref:Uncharacterized protein n=1 Tax=marine sediment metagenome TaxID=412755 RepID=A0A0F9NRK2_9ZZZZ
MADPIVISVLNNNVALDKLCWCCEGGIVDPSKSKYANAASFFTEGVCDMCEGVGYELTDAGQAVMDLIKRHCYK